MNYKETNVMKKRIKTHPGYAEEYWKLKAMFEGDSEILVGEIQDDTESCTISFKTNKKLLLFKNLIKLTYLKVHLISLEDVEETAPEKELAELFSTNPYFSRVIIVPDGTHLFNCVTFKPVCMHYFSDDMFSPTSHTAILPEQLVSQLVRNKERIIPINIKTDLKD